MDTVEQSTQAIETVEFKEVPVAPEADRPLNLPELITQWIGEQGVENPEGWLVGLDQEALTSPDLNIQRFIINRHWKGFLIKDLPREKIFDTINARGCLVDGRWDLADWIKHFKDTVIPCAIRVGVLSVKKA